MNKTYDNIKNRLSYMYIYAIENIHMIITICTKNRDQFLSENTHDIRNLMEFSSKYTLSFCGKGNETMERLIS